MVVKRLTRHNTHTDERTCYLLNNFALLKPHFRMFGHETVFIKNDKMTLKSSFIGHRFQKQLRPGIQHLKSVVKLKLYAGSLHDIMCNFYDVPINVPLFENIAFMTIDIIMTVSRFVNVWSQIKQIMSNVQPLEVVDRGSETQPQVVENSNKLTWQDKD